MGLDRKAQETSAVMFYFLVCMVVLHGCLLLLFIPFPIFEILIIYKTNNISTLVKHSKFNILVYPLQHPEALL